MLKSDKWFKDAIKNGIIEGGQTELVRKGVLSYGVSSYGYDIQLENRLKIMRATGGTFDEGIIDPKDCKVHTWVTCENVREAFILPPYSFALGCSKEYFRMPRNITGIVYPKSTYARCGLICMQTVIEAGWEGQITLEFANVTPNSIKLYPDEGCAQVLFFEGTDCERSYADRHGKYQGQKGITLPRVER